MVINSIGNTNQSKIGITTTIINATMEEIKIPMSGNITNKIRKITTPTNVKANKTMAITANGLSTLRLLIINCILLSFSSILPLLHYVLNNNVKINKAQTKNIKPLI